MKQFTSKTQKIGEKGEDLACTHLKKIGFSIVERNSANKFGEIDIVAKKGSTYYFFEVKTGKQGGWINPAENLTKEKLRKLYISVEHYCMAHGIKTFQVQGIVVVLSQDGQSVVNIEVLELT